MAESSYDYLMNRDKKEKEDKPWLDFNYSETVTPQDISEKTEKNTHNIAEELAIITSNSQSKLNKDKSLESSEKDSLPDDLTVTTIKTGEEQDLEKNDEYSKD